MGTTTDYLGHFTIDPPLNDAERDYLAAFCESRRWARPGGPYAVPPHPLAEEAHETDVEAFNRCAAGQPDLWCQWVPCPTGCCLSWDGREHFLAGTRWLQYLVDHFLRPGGEASRSGDPAFEGFTFDHRVDGVVAACRRDTRRLFLIEAVDGVVVEHELVAGLDEAALWGPFPYEDEYDRWAPEPRPRWGGAVGAVVRSKS